MPSSDSLILIPIIFRLIIVYFITLLMKKYKIISIVIILILSILLVMIPNLARRHYTCKDIKSKEDENENDNQDQTSSNQQDKKKEKKFNIFNIKQWYGSFVDSIIQLGSATFFTVIFCIILNFISKLGPIGIVIKIINKIPFMSKIGSNLLWCILYLSVYFIVNSSNERNLDNLCYPDKFYDKNQIIKLSIGFTFIIIGEVVGYLTNRKHH